MKRWPLITSFALFIALCASAAYWAMQLFAPPMRPVAAPAQAIVAAPDLNAAASLLGGRGGAAVASNFQLKGVVVASNPLDSVALLTSNVKPAQSFKTNQEVTPGTTLKEVARRYVLLSEGGVLKRVELPENAKSQMKVDILNNAANTRLPQVSQPNPPNTFRPSANRRSSLQP